MRQRRQLGTVLAAAAVWVAGAGGVTAQQIHRNRFETRETIWARGPAEASFRETGHDRTDATAHTGQLSERLQLAVEQGTSIHYTYALGRAPLTEDLTLSLWLKANRPGCQLLARVVLPRERNASNLDEPMTTLLRGDVYQQVSRWQRLQVRRPHKLGREQQQLLRAQLGRDVDFTDAYVDQLVLNLYCGPGATEAWIDDLEAGPVLE